MSVPSGNGLILYPPQGSDTPYLRVCDIHTHQEAVPGAMSKLTQRLGACRYARSVKRHLNWSRLTPHDNRIAFLGDVLACPAI